MKMDRRDKDLGELRLYIEGVEKEVTMLLQSLQWDRKHLLEGSTLVPCRYDATHKVPPDKRELHERECLLRREGYSKDDIMLPDPFDPEAATVVKLSKEDIQHIIESAAKGDPSFRRGPGCPQLAPLTAERLRTCFSADELRAIHDHVVSAAPDFEHVEDIDLASAEVKAERRRKSRLEVLAELRDMRRRRAKYRGAGAGAAASSKYSNVLRDLIKTQMELYTGTSVGTAPTYPSTSRQTSTIRDNTIHVKQEPVSDDESTHAQEHHNRDRYSQRNDDRDRSYREQIEPRRRDNTNGSHRNHKERQQFIQERERNKHAYDKRRRHAHVKQEPTSDDDDRRERRKERDSGSRSEFKEKHRDRDRYHDTRRHSTTNEKYPQDRYSHGRYSDSRRKASNSERYPRDHDSRHSISRIKREDLDSSSRDAHSSKRKQSEDRASRNESHHKRSKCRERSASPSRDNDRSNDDNMYKRYYAMKRALADPKR